MRIGDRVTGVPVNHVTRKKFPTVTGTYDKQNWELMGSQQTTEFVMVGVVAVDCKDIRLAERRDRDTEF